MTIKTTYLFVEWRSYVYGKAVTPLFQRAPWKECHCVREREREMCELGKRGGGC